MEPQFISALNCVVSNTCYHWGHCWLSLFLLVNWRRGFSCTHPWLQHVHLQCYTGVWHSWYSRVCAALQTQRYSLCPHCATHSGFTSASKQTQRFLQLQNNSTHSHNLRISAPWHTSDTVGQQIPEHNLNSLLPYSKSIITPISTTWHGRLFYLWWCSFQFEWQKYSKQTDTSHIHHRLIDWQASTTTSLPVQHICRALRSHNTLMMRAGVTCGGPWDEPAITQPQGTTEEFHTH